MKRQAAMFETVGDGPRLNSSQPPNWTRCCTTLKRQAAMFETVGDGPRLGSSRPPNRTRCCTIRKQQAAMLKPSETGRAWAAAGPLTGHGVAPL
ncbi:MAG: hypothetical protein LBD24_03765 [Spirochaetaceae bacterium]|nr:hypothetical protein [Spirochaetaceae bacterium]